MCQTTKIVLTHNYNADMARSGSIHPFIYILNGLGPFMIAKPSRKPKSQLYNYIFTFLKSL